jgi:hypothetical protein
MLTRAISCVDHRDRGKFSSKSRCSFFWVPDYNCICVPAHHPDSIGKRLSFGYRAGFNTSDRKRSTAQPGNSGLKRHPGPGAWFKEKNDQNFALQGVFVEFFLVNLPCMIQQ